MALSEGAGPRWLSGFANHDVFLLSDGSATWGDKGAFRISKTFEGHNGALFAYSTALGGSDPELLAHVTRQARGAVFAVTGPAEVASAAVAHRQRPWHIVSASIHGTEDVMLAGRPTALFPGQRVTMVGRGNLASSAAVDLVVRQPGASAHTVRIPLDAVVPSPLAERAYGHIAVRQLESLEGAAAEVARAYALHFRVPGESASLLMLESAADYARHGIEPSSDQQTVGAYPASPVVASALKSASAELGDPKALFLKALSDLETMPGIELALGDAARDMIVGLPPSAFGVAKTATAARTHDASILPASFRQRLATQSITYDDVVNAAAKRADAGGALRALSSLVELNPGDAVLQRDIGYSAMEMGQPSQAFALFHRVATARPHEPQSYRAMARALAALKRADLAMAYFEIALADAWRQRYPQLATIVAVDYLDLLQRVERGQLAVSNRPYAKQRLAELASSMRSEQADLVIMISWNTNNTDIDLHVVEPSGEECMYSHPNTQAGGSLTRDVTTGFGPEMYRIPKAPSGKYRISAKYFSAARSRLSARTKVHAVVIGGYGTPNQRTQETTLTLDDAGGTHGNRHRRNP